MFSGIGELVDTLEAHVFARAYLAAWLARYGSEPANVHVFDRLDLTINYGDPADCGGTPCKDDPEPERQDYE
jgi:hypothetical protein